MNQFDRQEWAAKYKACGFEVLPLESGSKNPKTLGKNWHEKSYPVEAFAGEGNIGVQPGAKSGNVVDIDLDASEAIEAADYFLPETGMVHGRKGKRRSHRWYKVTGNLPAAVEQYPDPADNAMLVELRSSDGTKGVQTVVPPSVHQSGEWIEWSEFGPPGEIDGKVLQRLVRVVTVVALLARHWPNNGSRHNCALAIAGFLLRAGIDEELVRDIIFHAAEIAGDEEAESRARNVDTTAKRIQAGQYVHGAPKLVEIVGQTVVTAIGDWLGIGRNQQRGTPVQKADEGDVEQTVDAFGTSEADNANRLVAKFGQDLRWCGKMHTWLIWDGRRWRADDCDRVLHFAEKTARGIFREAERASDSREREKLAKWAITSLSEHGLRAMISIARSKLAIDIDELDRDEWVLNTKNGTLDLHTGELRPHRREDYITKLAPVPHDPKATAPVFERFLDEIMDGNQGLVTFIQRYFGMALTGDTSEKLAPFFYGEGDNGKSTLIEAFAELLGDYAKAMPVETIMAKENNGGVPNDVAMLKGARFVFTVEVEQGKRLNESRLKQLTGRDTVTARFMRAEFFHFKPEFKLVVATNHMPFVRGTDRGIWTRLRTVPFTVSIPKDKQDKQLPQKLRAELPGILAWAVRGCLDWQQHGLPMPPEVIGATEALRKDMDIVGTFLEDECVVSRQCKVQTKKLYDAYKTWCDDAGEYRLTSRQFNEALRERGLRDQRGTGNQPEWSGLGLRTDYPTVTEVTKVTENPPLPHKEAIAVDDRGKSVTLVTLVTTPAPTSCSNAPTACYACQRSVGLDRMMHASDGTWMCESCMRAPKERPDLWPKRCSRCNGHGVREVAA